MSYRRYYKKKKTPTILGLFALFFGWLLLVSLTPVSASLKVIIPVLFELGVFAVFIYVVARILRLLFPRIDNSVSSLFSGTPSSPKAAIPFVTLNQGGDKYRLKPALVTYAEASFMKVLEEVVGSDYRVVPQVALASLVTPRNQSQYFIDYHDFNRIKAKSIDFVLYDKDWRPYLAIELDDSSHSRPDRVARDEFVRSVMSDVGLPFIQIPRAHSYNAEALRTQIFQFRSLLVAR